MSRALLAALSLALAMPVMAETPPPPATPAPPPKQKLICKTYAETGSLIARKKVCRTKAELWQEADDIQNMNETRTCVGQQCSGIPG